MGCCVQFQGQVLRAVKLKSRRYGRLLTEILAPLVLFIALGALKGLSEIDAVPSAEYSSEARQVPELDAFVSLDPQTNPYLLVNFPDVYPLVSTIGWTCDLDIEDAGTGFEPNCENLRFAIVPQDKDNAELVETTEQLRDFIVSSSGQPDAMASKIIEKSFAADEAELVEYIESTSYGISESQPRIGLAIVMTSPLSYTIRTNFTVRNFEGGPPPNANGLSDLERGRTNFNADALASGVLSTQMTVDRFLINRETGRNVTLKASHFPMPTSDFKQDEFWTVEDTVQLFGLLAVLYPTASVIMFLVEDKSTKIRELMFTMGLRPIAYQLAWLLVFTVVFTVVAVLLGIVSSNSVFLESETSVLIVFMWLFIMDVLAFAFLVSSIFSRTTIAVVIGLITTFLCNTMYTSLNNENTTADMRSMYSILHPILGFSFGVVAFAKYEVGLIGVSWDNYDLSENDELTVQQAMINLTVAIVWHLLAAAYIDSLSRHKWHWPITQWFRSTSSNQSQYAADADAVEEVSKDPKNRFEPVPAALKELRRQGRCVMIHNATKDFKTSKGVVHALRGLSVDMFEGQITVLLGPNGAGKSTTSSIITGVINPTSGHAYVNGQKCETNLEAVRKSLGVCPQHNILDSLLTVRENLQVVASIKGVPKAKIEARIQELLGDVGLLPKAFTAVKNLSGGMKRKLQLAMALFDSKVVILDEPTSGMDTFARQAAQRTITKHREGRTIILTTHYMDEADILGDRIAIVADGKLACCGTSLYLKKQYGVGYLLSFEQRSEKKSARETIMEIVRSHVPEMEVLSNVGSELVLRLPLSASPAFAGMLRAIETRKAELGIDEVGISVTTLDSVFHSATEGTKTLMVGSADSELSTDAKTDAGMTTDGSQSEAIVTQPVSGMSLVNTLIRKRMLNSSRDRRAWCCQILIPIVFLFLGFSSSLSFENQVQPVQVDLTEGLEAWNEVLGKSPIPYGTPGADSVVDFLSLPYLDKSQNVSITSAGPFCIEGEELFNRASASLGLLVLLQPGLKDIQEALLGQIALTNTICDDSSGYNASTIAFSDYLDESRLSLQASRYGGLLVQDLQESDSSLSAEYTVAYNFTGQRASSSLMSRTNAALLRLWTGNPEVDIKASVQPLPITFRESQFVSAIAGFPAVLTLGTAFSFFAAQFAVFMVHEKETKSWHQQLINGVSPRAYWFSNYLFDVVSFLLPFAVAIGLLFAFDVQVFVDEIGVVIFIFAIFALAITPFTYCLSFLFSSSAAAQTGVLGIHILGSMVLFIVSFIMGLLENTVDINDILVYIYRLFPTFALANALSRISLIDLLTFVLNTEENGGDPLNPKEFKAYDIDIAGKDILFLIAEAIIYPLLLVFIQTNFRSGLCEFRLPFGKSTKAAVDVTKLAVASPEVSELDSDVVSEAALIKDIVQNPSKATDAEAGHEEMAALLAGVRKVYPNGKVAVKDMSLGFRKNECFGLLGVNGAGKSTTQAMLSAEFPPTSGEIRIGTADVVRDPAGAQRHLGYCPQFDALFELLTGREHLSFYAKVKGIPAAQRAQVVQNKLEQFDLTKFGDKPAGGYSGGNKRKLSVAIATIGDPDFVLLDEPSAGVDPEARKFLAKAIQKLATKTSICLTTHSMEECEALCARIGIMVDGGLQCLGSAQHLKSKFGRGMQFEAMLRMPEDDEVEETIDTMNVEPVSTLNKAQAISALKDAGASDAVLHSFESSYIASELSFGTGAVQPSALADWYITECSFFAVMDMLSAHFDGEAHVSERQGNRVRISIPQQPRLSLGDMFDIIERHRGAAGIADFALSQTTLESIFNGMAAQQSDARD